LGSGEQRNFLLLPAWNAISRSVSSCRSYYTDCVTKEERHDEGNVVLCLIKNYALKTICVRAWLHSSVAYPGILFRGGGGGGGGGGKKLGCGRKKFLSFNTAEPNSQFRGKYIGNNLIRIPVSLICKLSGTPNYGATASRSPYSLPCPLSTTQFV
jgi:hypothetical protein